VTQPRTASNWTLQTLLGSNVRDAASLPHICMPPMPAQASTFSDIYEIWLLLDTREQFDRNVAGKGASRPDSFEVHLAQIRSCGVNVEARGLLVGDAVWVARCKQQVAGGVATGALTSPAACCMRPPTSGHSFYMPMQGRRYCCKHYITSIIVAIRNVLNP
jgi:hypothetical protein